MKQAISTMTMIRSLVDNDESASMSMIPNEILFEIFSMLEAPERIKCDRSRENTTTTTTTKKMKSKCTMM